MDFSISDITRYTNLHIPKTKIKTKTTLTNYLIKMIQEKNIKFNDNFSYNHLRFFNKNNINLGVFLEMDKNNLTCHLTYKDKTIHIFNKGKEVYFKILIVYKLYKSKKFSHLFFPNKTFNEEKIKFEVNEYCNDTKRFRVDVKINISDNYYFIIEFFEKYHFRKNDPGFDLEKNRLNRLLYDNPNQDKITFAYIFWETDLAIYNDNIFNNKFKFMIKKYFEYKNINDRKMFCTEGINKYINNKFLAETIYDSHLNVNKPSIDIKILNKIIFFKNDNSANEYCFYFKDYINRLYQFNLLKNPINNNKIQEIQETQKNNMFNDVSEEDSDEKSEEDLVFNQSLSDFQQKYYVENKLTYSGLILYLNVPETFIIDIFHHYKLLEFHKKITDGFIEGLISQHDKLKNLENNRIIGLYDYNKKNIKPFI
jgi:hypothetical protein